MCIDCSYYNVNIKTLAVSFLENRMTGAYLELLRFYLTPMMKHFAKIISGF